MTGPARIQRPPGRPAMPAARPAETGSCHRRAKSATQTIHTISQTGQIRRLRDTDQDNAPQP